MTVHTAKRRTGRPGLGEGFAKPMQMVVEVGHSCRAHVPHGHHGKPVSTSHSYTGQGAMVEKLRLHSVNKEAPRFRGNKRHINKAEVKLGSSYLPEAAQNVSRVTRQREEQSLCIPRIDAADQEVEENFCTKASIWDHRHR